MIKGTYIKKQLFQNINSKRSTYFWDTRYEISLTHSLSHSQLFSFVLGNPKRITGRSLSSQSFRVRIIIMQNLIYNYPIISNFNLVYDKAIVDCERLYSRKRKRTGSRRTRLAREFWYGIWKENLYFVQNLVCGFFELFWNSDCFTSLRYRGHTRLFFI